MEDHNIDPQMTDEEFEELLDDIEQMLFLSIGVLHAAKEMFYTEEATVYPDEAAALHQCLGNMVEVSTSIKLRREHGTEYDQPARVAELIDEPYPSYRERDDKAARLSEVYHWFLSD